MKSTITVPAIAFVGKQNSGKTTLLEKLIAELTARGVRVGTVKHHSHVGFEFDVVGKDSWRHRQAGSRYTMVASPDQIASVQIVDPTIELSLEYILERMTAGLDESLGTMIDCILTEGYRQSGLPTIELFRADNPKDANRPLGGEGNHIIAVVTDIPRIVEEASVFDGGVPVFGFEDIALLADFVQATLNQF